MKKYFNHLTWLAFGLIFITFQACFPEPKDPYAEQQKKDDEAVLNYLETNNIEAEKAEEGYYYESVVANSEGRKVEIGSILEFYYTIRTLNGEVLESTTEETHDPVIVRYSSESTTIMGLTLGLSQMREGETFKFYIPSYLAYGAGNMENIPAFSNFEIEVSLSTVMDVTERKAIERTMIMENIQAFLNKNQMSEDTIKSTSEGLYYIVLHEGEGTTPITGERVKVDYIGTLLDGTKFDSSYDRGSPGTFNVGIGKLIQGWEDILMIMPQGTQLYVWIPSHLAYGGSYAAIPSFVSKPKEIPPFAPLKFYMDILQDDTTEE